jgi:hypothetical protein
VPNSRTPSKKTLFGDPASPCGGLAPEPGPAGIQARDDPRTAEARPTKTSAAQIAIDSSGGSYRGKVPAPHGKDGKACRPKDVPSTKPLREKIAVPLDGTAVVLHAPAGYAESTLGLPRGATVKTRLPVEASWVQIFATTRGALESDLARAASALADSGALWVSWPKKTSGVETDITEHVVRELAFPLGLVDVKVVAVDSVWTGLKLVRRLVNRAPKDPVGPSRSRSQPGGKPASR